MEEQKTKEALELVKRKHNLKQLEGERDRARLLQRLGGSRAVRQGSDAQDTLSLESCSSSMACDKEDERHG